MTQLSKEAYETKYNDPSSGLFRNAKPILASDQRTMITDQKDSVLWKSNDLARVWLLCEATEEFGNDYNLSMPYAITDYGQHEVFAARFDTGNTDVFTLKYDDGVNILDPLPVKKATLSGYVFTQSGDVIAGGVYMFAYLEDEECFLILNPQVSHRLQRTLSTSEILTGNSSPVTLVPAQGAGKIIIITSPVVHKFKYGSAPFATNVDHGIYYGSSQISGPLQIIDSTANAIAINQHPQGNFIWTPPTTVENAPILFMVNGGNPTGGTGSTLVVEFEYQVLSL